MRQIGSIDRDEDAERFSDYLTAQGIENMVEEGGGGAWAVWIENDDLLDRSRAELVAFRTNPACPRGGAPGSAGKSKKQPGVGDGRRRRNVIAVGARWGRPAQRVRPVPIVLAAISPIVSVGGT